MRRHVAVVLESREPLTLLSGLHPLVVIQQLADHCSSTQSELGVAIQESFGGDSASFDASTAGDPASTTSLTGPDGLQPSNATAADMALAATHEEITASVAHGVLGGAAGVDHFRQDAPTPVTSSEELNQPLGQARADQVAAALGLNKSLCFTPEQYLAFSSGQGKNGSGSLIGAELVDRSVAILTNSSANPLIRDVDGKPSHVVLGSYGLTVSAAGMLERPANAHAPTRKVNSVIAPGGYLSTWAAANGAKASLQMLYQSADTIQLPYETAPQHEGGPAELALDLNGTKSAVTGLSMVPSIWEINFALISMLNPKLAANMPAYWAPIPANVVAALEQSPTGQVPFSKFASEFGG